MLSKEAASEPGRWRTDRTPYMREIMDCLSDHSPVRQISFMKGAQIGASEAGLNWIGYVIDHAPAPMMVLQPTDGMAKRFSNQRLRGLVSGSPDVQNKVGVPKARDSGNTMLFKEFPGGILLLAGANSAAGLSSIPIKCLFLDEIDRYPIDLPGEGDPIKLAEARTRTFAQKKIFRASTPTIAEQSQIEKAYEMGDRRLYYVPCPHCGHMQTITWGKLKFDRTKPDSVRMECEACKKLIRESQKTKMLEAGEWRPSVEGRDPSIRSYHLSSLYSPVGWYSWAQAVEEFLESYKNEVRLRVFVNTVLGETWKAKGEAPEWQKLYDRRERYALNTIPREAFLLTAGVDVQKDRIEVEIVAWGENFESWSIDYRTYMGDTSKLEVFNNLDGILAKQFPYENQRHPREVLEVKMLAVDTGYNTNTVYNWCRGKGVRVMPIKGIDNNVTLVSRPTYVDVNVDGTRVRRGLALWTIGTNVAKTEFYGWVVGEPKINKETGEITYPHGYCHFPEYDQDFFKMLTAEQMVKKVIRGYSRYVWEKVRERNEALDARCYARAAAAIAGIDRYTAKDWKALKDEKEKIVLNVPKTVKVVEKGGVKFRKSSGFL